jgi:hypothetical protein
MRTIPHSPPVSLRRSLTGPSSRAFHSPGLSPPPFETSSALRSSSTLAGRKRGWMPKPRRARKSIPLPPRPVRFTLRSRCCDRIPRSRTSRRAPGGRRANGAAAAGLHPGSSPAAPVPLRVGGLLRPKNLLRRLRPPLTSSTATATASPSTPPRAASPTSSTPTRTSGAAVATATSSWFSHPEDPAHASWPWRGEPFRDHCECPELTLRVGARNGIRGGPAVSQLRELRRRP